MVKHVFDADPSAHTFMKFTKLNRHLASALFVACIFAAQSYFTLTKYLPSDFGAYYYAAVVIAETRPEELYTGKWQLEEISSRGLTAFNPYVYTPFFATILAPAITLLDFREASLVWWFLNQILLFFLIRTVFKNHRQGWLLSIAILASMPVISVIRFGNVDLLFALFVAALLLFSPERPPSTVAVGIILGLMTAIKPTYASLILYHVILKKWKIVAISLLVVLGSLIVPLSVMGPGIYLDYLSTAGLYGQGNSGVINQSVNATISRAMTESPYYGPADVQEPTTVLLSTIVSVIIVITAFVLLWKHQFEYRHGLCTVIVITLVASPITWFAHCVILVPVISYVITSVEPDLAHSSQFCRNFQLVIPRQSIPRTDSRWKTMGQPRDLWAAAVSRVLTNKKENDRTRRITGQALRQKDKWRVDDDSTGCFCESLFFSLLGFWLSSGRSLRPCGGFLLPHRLSLRRFLRRFGWIFLLIPLERFGKRFHLHF